TLTVSDGETLVQDVQLVPVGFGIDEFGPTEQTYRIMNLMGQIVQSGILKSGIHEINTSALPRGVYLITIGSKTRKIVVE
ncbi:MAG: T9SS type A sorting domain-containing protein, partial [Bacteroidales bacterium]|nr:T9SS type A sorting domain-containing protein [Bacteroidales bacterium]